jgi:aryl-alcohol dehydrogenase-like predicted oxidoreductase
MKNNFTNKIAIGTVQFGVSYGVSNDGGQTSKHEVNKILQYAHDVGINTLDTASNYGCSEAVIGDFIQNNNNLLDFDIVTKIPNFPGDSINDYNICELIENFKLSCEKLGKIFIYGLHIHNCENLFLPGGDKLLREIEQLKIDGFIKKIGISVYNSDQIDRILDNFSIDLIQIPINILDQRLVNSGHLSKLKHNDIEIHARSVFLQGLLLMPIENIDPWFDPIKKVLYRFNIEARKRNLSALQLAFGFVQNIPEVDKIIVGVNTLKQLKEIVNIESTYFDPSEFSCLSVDNLKFINPSNWNP